MRFRLPRKRSSQYPTMAAPRRRGFSLLPIALFALYGLYYYFSNLETVPETGRRQLVSISHEQETALGLQSYQQILSSERVVPGGAAVDQVKGIGDKLAAIVNDPGFTWEFNLVESPQANAFALPGGKVAVYSGILPVAQNINGLAVIMGHEIAHAIARHGAERMSQQHLQKIGTMALSMSMSDMDMGSKRAVMAAFGMGSKFGIMLPFSRKHESEADYMGLLYVARACFDPREAPKLWKRMAKHSEGSGSGGRPAEFASTHPNPDTRVEQFEKWMPEAMQEYRKHCQTSTGSPVTLEPTSEVARGGDF